ncbi:hypothetical protein DFH06DRAFT_1139272 [Mycena polygramma]|nr:hypothetical protein DFH06DRAFT_1139272 [Mycena polygramma]
MLLLPFGLPAYASPMMDFDPFNDLASTGTVNPRDKRRLRIDTLILDTTHYYASRSTCQNKGKSAKVAQCPVENNRRCTLWAHGVHTPSHQGMEKGKIQSGAHGDEVPRSTQMSGDERYRSITHLVGPKMEASAVGHSERQAKGIVW